MAFTIAQGKEEVEAAHRFQISADMKDVRLLDCTASMSGDRSQLGEQLRLGMQMESAVLGVSEGEARFSVRITAFGDPKDAPEDQERHLFQVIGRYAMVYSLRPGYNPPQDELDAFKEGNAIFHCWPYTRELIQNLTMRMGLAMPPMPFLRLAPKREPKKAAPKRRPKPEAKEPADAQ